MIYFPSQVISHLKRSWQRLGAKIKRRDYQRTISLSAAATTHSELVSMAKDGRRNSANNSTCAFSNGNGHRRPVTKDSKISVVRYERGGSTLDNDHVSCLATGALATDDVDYEHVICLATDDDVDNEHVITRATFYVATDEGEYGLKNSSKRPLPSEQGTSTENDWRLG